MLARQMSGTDPDGNPILSVLVKRTFRIDSQGSCAPHEKPLPLVEDLVADPERPGLLAHDTDLYPFKPATDVVLQGSAYAAGEVSLHIGTHSKSILVIGDRECSISSAGRPVFSAPAKFERMPLRYDRAYGGVDPKREDPAAEWIGSLEDDLRAKVPSPYAYPRNPEGRGFTLEPREGLKLPNLEDPADRLTPDRLAAGSIGRWPLMPAPQAFDWVDVGWFPRIAHLGFVPEFDPLPGPLPDELARPRFSHRLACGASSGLQLPYLEGDETCRLVHLHPARKLFEFRLPGARPRIWTDGRNGKLNETQPVLHTVLIEPDEDRVSLVWRGSAPALRPYLPQELEKMPFRVEG